MTIQNPSTGPAQSGSIHSDGAQGAQEAASANETDDSSDAQKADASSSTDRVEISDAARSAQSAAAGDAALVERGRQVLQDSSLSADRLNELRQRVESGAYSDPSSIEKVAEKLAGALGGSA
jgi:anti-sigma28 factor (negative regulator of flagellin synthesis)